MVRNQKWLVVGIALVAIGVFLFARFWTLSGTETSVSGSGMLSNFDWGMFFVSPFLVFGGLSLAVWAALSGRARHRTLTSAEIHEQMRVLESTH
ncbi:hypothetical protein [Demequina oxidasica]|uniref:hypothetical protein n=1 Tax=Demequina oxidasica TaxID=676199 RepID=UPI000785FBA4|nr:hypothetical protein [Demequina oxidasica]